MAHIENNALLLKTDGTIQQLTVESSAAIKAAINCEYPEMTLFGRYPVQDPMSDANHDQILDFISFTVARAGTLPPPPKNDYDFHRIDHPTKIQMYIHEMGALIPLPANPFFGGYLYGDVLMLGQCIDELPRTA